MELILASASPRRQELLKNLGIPFKVQVSNVSEKYQADLSPGEMVENLALLKAKDVAQGLDQGIVLGADTIVVLDGKVLGKPQNEQEAKEMLLSLSGREHLVLSGIALIDKEAEKTAHEITRCWFKKLTEEEVKAYIATKEPFDKAGGYGIQGKGSFFVQKIEGCFFNVVGLPLGLLYSLLKEKGMDLLSI